MDGTQVQENMPRTLPAGLAPVVAAFEMRNATVVTLAEITRIAGLDGQASAKRLAYRLVQARWLQPLAVKGTYEFLPGRAGPFSRSDDLDALRGLLRQRPAAEIQLSSSGAAFLRGFADRAPVEFTVLVPAGAPVSARLRRTYRFHWVAFDRIFGSSPVEGIPVSTPDRLVLDVALWPEDVGPALRASDHWLRQALEHSTPEGVVAYLRRLDSPTVTARAGHLADAFGRPDIADAIAGLGRARLLVPLLPGFASTAPALRDRRFNVSDPIGAGSIE
jgi:predicted transcriptional regulator of viral defense system